MLIFVPVSSHQIGGFKRCNRSVKLQCPKCIDTDVSTKGKFSEVHRSVRIRTKKECIWSAQWTPYGLSAFCLLWTKKRRLSDPVKRSACGIVKLVHKRHDLFWWVQRIYIPGYFSK